MIIKGKGRGRARELAAHLLRADENERVELIESRGTVARDVAGALLEMEARASAVPTKRPLYHASISPDPRTPLRDDEMISAVDTLENKLGLAGQPRLVVRHRKMGREHVHVVWARIDLDRGTVIPDSWNYRAHEDAARELEALFGHRHVPSSKAGWNRAACRATRDYEHRQAGRSGISASEVTSEITAIWKASRNGEELREKLEAAGYALARGDRRVFVVIDRHGDVHSLARRISGASAQDVRSRLQPIDLRSLPSVNEARERQPKAKAPSARPLIRGFRAAAAEVGGLAHRRVVDMPSALRTILEARATFAAVTRAAPPTRSPRPARVIREREPDTLGHYRRRRAVLVASFAAKISTAIRDARRDELDAVLEALMAERDDALRALSDDHRHGRRSARARKRTIPRKPPSAWIGRTYRSTGRKHGGRP